MTWQLNCDWLGSNKKDKFYIGNENVKIGNRERPKRKEKEGKDGEWNHADRRRR